MRLLHDTAATWLSRAAVAAPPAHAELLNQLRAADTFARRFPRVACAHLLPDGPLKAKYRKLLADAERHDRHLTAAIRRLGGEPRDVPVSRDHVLALWREALAADVGVGYARFAEARPLDRVERMRLWALQAVAAERRVAGIGLHRAACEAAGKTAVVEVLDGILAGGRAHVADAHAGLEAAGTEAGGAHDAIGGAGGDAERAAEVAALLAAVRAAEVRAHQRVMGAFVRAMLDGPLAGAGLATRAALRAWVATLPVSGAEPEGAW